MSKPKRTRSVWIVCSMQGWENVSLFGVPMPKPPKGQPDYWMPVFNNEDDAKAWANPGALIAEGEINEEATK